MDDPKSGGAAEWIDRNGPLIDSLKADFLRLYVENEYSLKNTLAFLGISFAAFRLARLYHPDIRRIYQASQDMMADAMKAALVANVIGRGKQMDRGQITSAIAIINNHFLVNQHSGSFEDIPPEIRRMVVPRPLMKDDGSVPAVGIHTDLVGDVGKNPDGD